LFLAKDQNHHLKGPEPADFPSQPVTMLEVAIETGRVAAAPGKPELRQGGQQPRST